VRSQENFKPKLPWDDDPRSYSEVILDIHIAMENDPFIDGLPIENGDFPWLC